MLEQIVKYVGADRSRERSVGRKFPAHAGITGRSLASRGLVRANRTTQDYEQYVRELQNEWSYTEQQARQLNPASMAWMAIPLVVREKDQDLVRGIVYLDSTDPEYFNDERAVLAEKACAGIARFVTRL